MPPASPRAARRPALAVLAGGLIVGTLDILYACLFWKWKARVPARRIFQSVAAGVLGRASFPALLRRPWLAGAGYGLVVYGVMNHVVVPFSAVKQGSKDPLWVRLSIAVHIACVGIPIAVAAARARRGAGV